MTSLLGGFVSFLVVAVTYSFLGKLIYTMYIMDNNSIGSSEATIELDKIGEIKYADMSILFFFSMLSTDIKHILDPIHYDVIEFSSHLAMFG